MVYLYKDQPKVLQPIVSAGDTMDDNQAVDVVDALLANAAHQGASDIHIEPQQNSVQIRQRLDGVLTVLESLPLAIAPRLISRIKVMAQLDIAERRLPQDGRIQLREKSGPADIRVSTLPTLWGEKAVLRLLDHQNTGLEISSLGMDSAQQKLFSDLLQLPQGLILVTGPTGSGKTLTLYSALQRLNCAQRNISAVEDPIEIHLQGINQIAVNTKIDLSFARVLRALMRQDPDVIMVGEIRDLETATAAIRAAQTGHLVLSTLHTSSAGSALSRLNQMGIKLYDLTSTVSLVVAQRLARRLCDYCKTAMPPLEGDLQGGAQQPLFSAHASGCSHCQLGYRGRIGIFELMPMDDGVVSALHGAGSRDGIIVPSKEFIRTSLRDAAMAQAFAGITSIDEVNRLAPR
jgi:type IV pilus assembly protein PilB